MIVDAHLHVWDPTRSTYDWLGPHLAPIDRAITFDEATPELDAAGVTASVLVQSADTTEDTQLMIETSRQHPRVVAIVAFVPLHDPSATETQLEALLGEPLVVGVRNLIHTKADPDWLMRAPVQDSLRLVAEAGLTFDLVGVLPRHLELAQTLGSRHPDLAIVLDHLSHPPIGAAGASAWHELIARAAENPRIHAKISGLYSTVGPVDSWTVGDIQPYVDHAFEVFGAHRLMYGGDWPISLLGGGYARVWAGVTEALSGLDSPDRDRVLATNALEFYGIPNERVTALLAEGAP